MPTTFDDDEISASGSRPINLYTITSPNATYRLTSHPVDVVYAGNTYTATTMDRGDQQVAQDLTGRELVVTLPITHPIVQRYCASGIPPRELLVTVLRLQESSGEAQQEHQGFGNGISVDGGTLAHLRVPSITDDALKIQLPVVRGQRTCNHQLGDRGCAPIPGVDGPDLNAFRVDTAASSQSGTTLVILTMGGQPDQWATFGAVVHLPSGERRRILEQVGTTLALNVPFVGLAVGDGLSVFAGCDHRIQSGCRDKFGNVPNFGGHPYMLTKINPFLPKGVGVIEQT